MPSGPIRRGWVSALARRGADGDDAVGLGHGRPIAAVRQIEAVRRGLLEDIHPLAENAPVLPSAGKTRLALDHDEDDLAIASRLGDGLARAEPPE